MSLLSRIPSTTLSTAGLLLIVAFGITTPAPGQGPSAAPTLPDPELAGLEKAVAAQLLSMRELAMSVLANPDETTARRAEATGELGRLYHAYKLSGPAEECYSIARDLAPEDFRWPYHLAYLLQAEGRPEEAAAAFETALAIHSAVPAALIRLGQTYVTLDRPEAAERNLREALRLDPTSAAALAALGELELSRKRFREAVDYLELALELTPEANRLFYPLALAYRGLGDSEHARQLLAQRGTVGVKPADPMIDSLAELTTGERVHLLRGQTAYRAGRVEEAAAEFGQAVDAQPDSIAARINLGSALGELDRLPEAIAEYERAVELAPGNETAHFNLGILLAKRGELDSAVSHVKSAGLLAPDDGQIRYQLAELLVLTNRPSEALVHYRAAIEHDPPGELARIGEARVLVDGGRYREARDRLQEAYRLLPASGLIAYSLARILAACPVIDLRDGDRALELARKVFEARRHLADAELVAEALAESGRCEEAAEWQRQVVEEAAQADQPTHLMVRLRRTLDRFEQGPPCRLPDMPDAG